METIQQVKVEIANPKNVFQECLTANILTEQELPIFYKMIEARNLTSHTCNESLAKGIAQEVCEFYVIIKQVMNRTVIDSN